MESHNHPSFIEPYQGAATGVGGIMRDVFTMGARPIANHERAALRRARPSQDPASGRGRGRRHRRLRQLHGRADGRRRDAISTRATTATSWSTPCPSASRAPTASSIPPAQGAGNPVVYVGSKTGRDGIHGATMASAEFDEASDEKRPTVQVGDPFTEKLLLEACLELMATTPSSPSRTWARRVSPPPRSRWPTRAASASSSTSTRCRSAKPT